MQTSKMYYQFYTYVIKFHDCMTCGKLQMIYDIITQMQATVCSKFRTAAQQKNNSKQSDINYTPGFCSMQSLTR